MTVPDDARSIEAAYDSIAATYDSWKWQAFWRRNELPELTALLDREPPAARYLDVGAGTGQAIPALLDRSTTVCALDRSAGMLARLRRKIPAVQAVRGDAGALPFRRGSFDRIVMLRVLSHIADLDGLLRECRRVATAGALVVISDLHPSFDYDRTSLGAADGAVALRPWRHDIAQLAAAGRRCGLDLERLQVVGEPHLQWNPPAGLFRSLDRNRGGPTFYLAAFRAVPGQRPHPAGQPSNSSVAGSARPS